MLKFVISRSPCGVESSECRDRLRRKHRRRNSPTDVGCVCRLQVRLKCQQTRCHRYHLRSGITVSTSSTSAWHRMEPSYTDLADFAPSKREAGSELRPPAAPPHNLGCRRCIAMLNRRIANRLDKDAIDEWMTVQTVGLFFYLSVLSARLLCIKIFSFS